MLQIIQFAIHISNVVENVYSLICIRKFVFENEYSQICYSIGDNMWTESGQLSLKHYICMSPKIKHVSFRYRVQTLVGTSNSMNLQDLDQKSMTFQAWNPNYQIP